MKNRKLLSLVLSVSMFLSITSPVISAYAEGNGAFSNPLAPVEKVVSSEKFTAKPLVILMDFPDYKHEDLDKKESWRINKFSGKDTTPEFYEKLFFGDETYKTPDGNEHITVNKFFKEESGGTYEFKGKVVGWYTADKEAAYYGKNINKSDQARARELVVEAIEKASKDIDLSEFDIEDKWDLNGNGNYDEPDGIIDSVVVIHAGMGEEWGGGSLKEDAIWPFRWGFNIFGEPMEMYTPEKRQKIANKNKKVTDKKGKEYLIEDFTIFEQDLPLDLFCHEFGHVLGLPDLYSTADSKPKPPVENWSIMGGSYTGDPMGSQPVSYGAYCKEFLQKDFEKRNRAANWQKSIELDLKDINENGLDVVLDQATIKGKNKEAVRINLPEATGDKITTPSQGNKCFFSGKGDFLENYMTTKQPIDLTNTENPQLSFKTWYKIDPGFDFASVQVREEGANEWITIKDQTDLTTDKVDQWIVEKAPETIKDRNPGWGITGTSDNRWLYTEFDLSQFKGKKVDLRFRFRTDANTPEEGIYIDEIKVKDGYKEILSDDAEGESKFDFKGFSVSDGNEKYNHYYLLEWRSSGAGTKVDKGLDLISTYTKDLAFETGLVIWYVNEKYIGFNVDQDCDTHPGEVGVGVVDADQTPIQYRYKDGSSTGPDRVQYQLKDAAFSIRPDREWLLDGDKYVVEDTHTFMNPVFSDKNDYTSPQWGKMTGLKLENYGLKIFVTDESKDRSTAKIHIVKDEGLSNPRYSTQDASMIKEISTKDSKLYITPQKEFMDKAYVMYSDINGREKEFVLNYERGKYVCDLGEIANKNIWKINYVIFEDKEGNAKAVYNREVNKIFGADFKELYSEIQTDVLNKETDFVKGKTSTVTVNVNTRNPIDEVTLLVGIYDEKGKMLGSSIKTEKGVIALGGSVKISTDIVIPNMDNIKVKIFTWDLKDFNPIGKGIVYNIK